MATRSVLVRLSAQVGEYVSNMGRAKKATEDLGQSQDQTSQSTERAESRLEGVARKAKSVEEAGKNLAAFGTVTVAALGAAAKAAMDWESAWAGVTKTVDGTPAQMKELERGLRDLAKELPSSHQEIAAVAEAAGQLGVKQKDVLGFTKTMIDLGETTNLSADEAATAIAQISNVMGTMEREGATGVARFGAALVELGNNGASTEKEILNMAQRMAGAMKLVGASESDLLAMANAMASVGIEAQLGGGVMSRTLTSIYAATQKGGAELDAWAGTARMSASDFSEAFSNDPVRALDSVVKGLQATKEEGGNVVGVLDELGIKGTQDVSVMLMLAGAGDLLTQSLDQGAAAWEANTALVEEAEKRYATTEAQVQMAWNSIKDAAIDAGAVLLPVIATMADGVGTLADIFGALPAPVQGVVTVLGGVAGVAALAVGGFIMLFPRVMDTVNSMKALRDISPGAASGLQKVGKAASVAGAIAAVGLALAKVAEASYMKDIETGMGQVAEAFAKVEAGGPGAASALDNLFKDRNGGELINNVDSLDTALDRMFKKSPGDKFNDFGQSVVTATTGIEGSASILEGSFSRMDQGLADLVNGGTPEQAAEVFANITKWAKENEVSLDDVSAKFPQYADALAAANAEQIKAGDGAEGVAGGLTAAAKAAGLAEGPTAEAAAALAEVGLAADGTIISLDKYLEMLFATGLRTMDTREASFNWAQSLREQEAEIQKIIDSQATLGPVLDDTGRKFNINTDAGKAANDMLIGMGREGLNVAQVMSKDVNVSQEQVQGQLKSTYDSLVNTGKGFKMTEQDAIDMAREVLGVPDNVSIESWMSEQAKKTARETTSEMNALDGRVVRTYIETRKTVFEDIVMGTSTQNRAPAGTGTVLRPGVGGALGGRVDDIMGFWSGGRVPGPAHPSGRQDNVLGMVNGKPIGLQGTEWIINPFSSAKYDKELSAINAGTFQQSSAYASAPVFTAPYGATASAAGASVSIDYERLAAAIESRPVIANLRIGNRDVAQANIQGRKELRLSN